MAQSPFKQISSRHPPSERESRIPSRQSPKLCGAVVIVEAAAEPLLPLNSSIGFPRCCDGDDQLIAQPLVISLRMIVSKKLVNSSPQGIFAEEDHSLQAFFLDRPDESFGEGVQVWRPGRQFDGLDSRPFLVQTSTVKKSAATI